MELGMGMRPHLVFHFIGVVNKNLINAGIHGEAGVERTKVRVDQSFCMPHGTSMGKSWDSVC